jgi:TonB family protein
MKKLRNGTGYRHLLAILVQSEKGQLLRTGIFSLLLHVVLIIFLMLNLKSAIPQGRSNVYWVTIRPTLSIPLPLLEKTQIEKEENESIPEGRERRPILNKENQEQVIPPPAQPVILSVPQEEQKPLLHHEKEEENIIEPILLPMADVSPLSTDLDKKTEDNLPILLRSSSSGEQSMNTLSNAGSGEGPGIGPGGSGEGTGLGQGGSVWRVGYGSGSRGGDSGRGGSRHGAAIRHGGSGWGAGDGSGKGQGGSNMGGSGKGKAGGPPGYAKNPKPVYPQEAREKGYQGEVLLRVEVLSNGQVGQVEVKRSTGYEVLDQSALTAVKQWKFIPARRGEVPIPVWVNIPIKFQLL